MAFVITESCTGCAACAPRCPTGAIAGARGGLHAVDGARCLDCGACGVVCLDEAIVDADGEICAPLDPGERPVAAVDAASCTGCRLCVWSCPFDALRMVPHAGSQHFGVAEVIAERCVGCALCVLDCPYGAVSTQRGGLAAVERAA